MICTLYQEGETHTRYLKYSNPIIGSKQIYNRVNGKWEEWCRPAPDMHKPCKLTITNRGATMQSVYEHTVENDAPEDNLLKGTLILEYIKYILDFEFVTRRVERHWTKMNGQATSDWTAENPHISNWDCKLK